MWRASDSECSYCKQVFRISSLDKLDAFMEHEDVCRKEARLRFVKEHNISDEVARVLEPPPSSDNEEEEDFNHIHGVLHVGNFRAAENCVSLGFDAVLNCAREIGASSFSHARPSLYLHLPLDDDPDERLVEKHADAIVDFVERVALLDRGRLLVHCALGRSRSVTATVLALMKMERWSLLEAMSVVRKARPIAYPNVGFWKQLIDYEKTLFDGKQSISDAELMGLHQDNFE